jgi:hypothetical protein
MAMDTTQATAANRLKLYINGSEITSFQTDGRSSITQNSDMNCWNTNRIHLIGSQAQSYPAYTHNGYFAEINFVDGLQLTPSSFGKTDNGTGQWIPKKFAGTYGTNGFYLKFADASAASATAIGKDSSGNENNWTPTNFSILSPSLAHTGLNLYPILDGRIASSGTADNATATFTTPISYSKLVVYYGNMANGQLGNPASGATLFINGSSVSATGTSGLYGYDSRFTKVYSTSTPGTLSSIGISAAVSGSYGADIKQIWVDDSLLALSKDSVTDVPTLGPTASNYATLNPLDMGTPSEPMSAGNLIINGGANIRATMACPSTGKWYFEYTRTNTTDYAHVGIFATSATITLLTGGSQLYRNDGGIYENNSSPTSAASYTTGDVIGVAVNCDASEISWYKNNTLQVTRSFVSQMTTSNAIFGVRNNTGATASVNFGQFPFTYTPPSGFKSLNAFNLP